MSKRNRIIIFFIILVADLVAVQGHFKIAEHFLKPLIIIWLLACFVLRLRFQRSDLKKWMIMALLFSWLGDVLLLFQADHDFFFLLGLLSFLIAHIFYIIFFHCVRQREMIKTRWFLLLIVTVYYVIVIRVLSPHLDEMGLPVKIYAGVISFMFLLALHMVFMKRQRIGGWMLVGALLFVISDTMLAINKFSHSFQMAAVLVMTTYGLAQFFLSEGAIRYIDSIQKE